MGKMLALLIVCGIGILCGCNTKKISSGVKVLNAAQKEPVLPMVKVKYQGNIADLPFDISFIAQKYGVLDSQTVERIEKSLTSTINRSSLERSVDKYDKIKKLVANHEEESGWNLLSSYILSSQINPATVLTKGANALSLASKNSFTWNKSERNKIVEYLEKFSKASKEEIEEEVNTNISNMKKRLTSTARKIKLLEVEVNCEPGKTVNFDFSKEVRACRADREMSDVGRLKPIGGFDQVSIPNEGVLFLTIDDTTESGNIYPRLNKKISRGFITYDGDDYTDAIRQIWKECVPITIKAFNDIHTFYVRRKNKSGYKMTPQSIITELADYIDQWNYADSFRGMKWIGNSKHGIISTNLWDNTDYDKWELSVNPTENIDKDWIGRPNTTEVILKYTKTYPPTPGKPLKGHFSINITRATIKARKYGDPWDRLGKWQWPDPYYLVKLDGLELPFSVATFYDRIDPRWKANENHTLGLSKNESIKIEFWDDDPFKMGFGGGDEKIGELELINDGSIGLGKTPFLNPSPHIREVVIDLKKVPEK